MLTLINDKYTVLMGDNVADVAAWLERTPREWCYDSSTKGDRTYAWDLGADWATCLRYAKEGWAKGAQQISSGLLSLLPPTAKETETRYDMAGYFPDVARFIAGDPAHMVRRGRRHGQAPVLSIIVNLTTSGSVAAQHYANFGVAMTAVIDQLEAQGTRVELTVTFANALRHTRAIVGWRVKAAEDHCDLAAIAFSIAHPAAYRRFGFGLWERTAKENEKLSYGTCSNLTPTDAAFWDGDTALIVNATADALSVCRDIKSAVAFVAKQINTAAGEELVTMEA